MATRPDYRTAVAEKIYLHRKPEEYQKTVPPPDQDRVTRKQQILRFVPQLESIRKLGGDFGHLLQAGGRLINGTGKNTN